CQKYTTSPFSF
nr:immunoglobulin light chain junction region [Macaca mulatta]